MHLLTQDHPFERIALLRITLGLIAIGLLMLGPYSHYYVEAAPLMFRPRFPFFGLTPLGEWYSLLKGVTFCLAALYATGFKLRVVSPLFCLCFLLLNFYTFCFHSQWDTEHSHLNFFLLLMLSVHMKPVSKEWASFVIFAMQAYVGMLYFQAGMTKLIFGGVGWFTSGDTIYVKAIMEGTDFGRYLTQWPALFPLFGIATAVFEFGFPLLLFWKRLHPIAALIAISFHLGTFAVLGISFWFLWTLFPALFFDFRNTRWSLSTNLQGSGPIV